MSTQVGELFANLSLQTSQFREGARGAVSEARRAGRQMEQAFSQRPQRGLTAAERSAQRFTWAVRGYMKDTARVVSGILIAQGFYKLIEVIKEGTNAVADFHNRMEVAQISFTMLLGTKEKAKQFLGALEDFTAATPFMMEQAKAAAITLKSMGFQAQNILPILRDIVDAVSLAGASPEIIERVVRAFGQMKTQGAVFRQELLQLAEAGIPVFDILREELNLTREDLRDITKLDINVDTAIAAILSGMRKRSGGAAKAISQTTMGIISTIKDNTLMLLSGSLDGAFEAYRNFLQGVAGVVSNLRATMRKSGVGGLFEALVPQEYHGSIRAILASLAGLWEAAKNLARAFGPLVRGLFDALLLSLTVLLPPLSALARLFTSLFSWVTKNIPGFRLLAAAIGTLLIATWVTSSLAGLRIAIAGLLIAVRASAAVRALGTAIRFFYVAMTSHPIAALITAIAGLMLYWAMQTDTVSKALDNLGYRVMKLMGMDISKMLQPEAIQDGASAAEEFWKELDQTGDAAANAGKKMKDFVASFDEVYDLPDKLDDIGDALKGSLPKKPELPTAEPPKLDDDGSFNLAGKFKSWWSELRRWWDENRELPPFIWPPTPPMPPMPPPPGVLVWFQETVKPKLAETYDTIIAWIADTAAAVSGWAGNLASTIGSWAVTTRATIAEWATTTTTTISSWTASTALSIGNWIAETSAALATWSTGTAISIATWIATTTADISSWVAQTGSSIASWTTQVTGDISTWVANTTSNIASWAERTASSMGSWASETAVTIRTWVGETAGDISVWVASTAASISQWAAETAAGVATWATDTATSLATWAASTTASLATWATNTSARFTSWVAEVTASISTWSASTTAQIDTWVQNTSATIATWVQNTSTTFSTWVANTVSSFSGWSSTVLGIIGAWAVETWNTFQQGMTNLWTSLKTVWLKSIEDLFEGWKTSLVATALAIVVGIILAFSSNLMPGLNETFKKIGPAFLGFISELPDMVRGIIPAMVKAAQAVVDKVLSIFSKIKLPSLGTPSLPSIAPVPLPGYSHGAVVTREHIARVGEKNKAEAIIPLSGGPMAPFAQAVASELVGLLPQQPETENSNNLPPMYVGTLIADEHSLRELERRMRVVRIEEAQRRGGTL